MSKDTSTGVRLSLGAAAPAAVAVSVAPILNDMKAGGFSIKGTVEAPILEVKFPGLSAIDFTEDQIAALCDRLTLAVPEITEEDPDNDPPEIVFARTATVDRAGNLRAKFSYKSKAREIAVPANEVNDLAALLSDMLEAGRAALRDHAEKAAAETAKKNGSK